MMYDVSVILANDCHVFIFFTTGNALTRQSVSMHASSYTLAILHCYVCVAVFSFLPLVGESHSFRMSHAIMFVHYALILA